jgi:hypothetical protein
VPFSGVALIEQFCERHNKQYVDGMDSKWDAASFRKREKAVLSYFRTKPIHVKG